MSKDTAIDKILRLLSEGNYSQKEIENETGLPSGTVRSTISVLKRLGLVKAAGESRGVPFTLTEAGRKHIEGKGEVSP